MPHYCGNTHKKCSDLWSQILDLFFWDEFASSGANCSCSVQLFGAVNSKWRSGHIKSMQYIQLLLLENAMHSFIRGRKFPDWDIIYRNYSTGGWYWPTVPVCTSTNSNPYLSTLLRFIHKNSLFNSLLNYNIVPTWIVICSKRLLHLFQNAAGFPLSYLQWYFPTETSLFLII